MSSRDAPPPVLTWVRLALRPRAVTAATESPPAGKAKHMKRFRAGPRGQWSVSSFTTKLLASYVDAKALARSAAEACSRFRLLGVGAYEGCSFDAAIATGTCSEARTHAP